MNMPISDELIHMALKEDIGSGDITSISTIPEEEKAIAEVVAKQEGIICGLFLAEKIFGYLEKSAEIKVNFQDGDPVKKGDIVVKISGSARTILTGERVFLNFVQRLSGIATLTKKFADLAEGAKILDTRKTTPLFRKIERYAVQKGGGTNHRFNLEDMVMIKENHIEVAGGIRKAVLAARQTTKKIEVEVTNLEELEEALDVGVDRIMLDNMSVKDMKEAVQRVAGNVELEASGNVTLQTVADIAGTGVDFISVGAITHSAPALDLSLMVYLR
ncbi:MAG: carboxylating nicotinate-nucleotide diphosphorylase [Candidatus Electrothrix sp. AW5]|nr:carboxylating nicotinate-nucleotide diphosphorylase [Candidatus Electrothrix sp. AX1]MCI5178480.1 carboxylating nicotinate-nucleotide diphosphorylase [Candidatus Electrothrix gigas]MCI5181815.1 carboxylating nicotinate-nucleotide diphosphorylase [Candidatus Electrothrix gigas]MCI5196309.1 carboxylating nicotinate-nucleotide diphosphorylase [Candidatus Electrothrix gigas]